MSQPTLAELLSGQDSSDNSPLLYQSLEVKPYELDAGGFGLGLFYDGGYGAHHVRGIDFSIGLSLLGLSIDPAVDVFNKSEFFNPIGSSDEDDYILPAFQRGGGDELELIGAVINLSPVFPSSVNGDVLPYEILAIGNAGSITSPAPIGLVVGPDDAYSSNAIVEYSDSSLFPSYLGFSGREVFNPELNSGDGGYEYLISDFSSGGGSISNTVKGSSDLSELQVAVSDSEPVLNFPLISQRFTLTFDNLDEDDIIELAGSSYQLSSTDFAYDPMAALASGLMSAVDENGNLLLDQEVLITSGEDNLVVEANYDFSTPYELGDVVLVDAYVGDIDFVSFKVPAGEIYDVFELSDFAATASNHGDTGNYVLVEGDFIDPAFVESLMSASALADAFELADLVDSSGDFGEAPSHNSITSQAEFEALIDVYAFSIGEEASFTEGYPYDLAAGPSVTAYVANDIFTWNDSVHGADAEAGTGPHATRNDVGLFFEIDELIAMQGLYESDANVQSFLSDTTDSTTVVRAGGFGATSDFVNGVIGIGGDILKEGLNPEDNDIEVLGDTTGTPLDKFYTMMIVNENYDPIGYEFNYGPGLILPAFSGANHDLADGVIHATEDTAFAPIALPGFDDAGNQLTWEIAEGDGPSWLTVNVNQLTIATSSGVDAEVNGAPPYDLSGDFDFKLTAQAAVDGVNRKNSESITLRIAEVNEAPTIIQAGDLVANEDEGLELTLSDIRDLLQVKDEAPDVANSNIVNYRQLTSAEKAEINFKIVDVADGFSVTGYQLNSENNTVSIGFPENVSGTDIPAFSLIAIDAGNEESIEFPIKIDLNAQPDAPVLTQPADVSLSEGNGDVSGTPFTSVDPDGETPSYALALTPTETVPDGLKIYSDGTWSFDTDNPAYDYLAAGRELIIPVTIKASDNTSASNSTPGITSPNVKSFDIILTGSNDAPVLANQLKPQSELTFDAYQAIEDQFKTWTYGELVEMTGAHEIDINADSTFDSFDLKISAFQPGSEAEKSTDNGATWENLNAGDLIGAGDQLRWKAPDDFFSANGTTTPAFSIQAIDAAGELSTNTQTVNVSVIADNDAPELIGFTAESTIAESFDGNGGTYDQILDIDHPYNEGENVQVLLFGADDTDLVGDSKYFEIDGDYLKLKNSADYEFKNQYDIKLRLKDSAGNLSPFYDFSLDVNDHPNQELTLSPANGSEVFVPGDGAGSTTVIEMELAYSEGSETDQVSSSTGFEYEVLYDDDRLEFKEANSDLSGIALSISDHISSDPFVSDDFASFVVSYVAGEGIPVPDLSLLSFDVKAGADIRPYEFKLNQISGDTGFEQFSDDSAAFVAPDADYFIGVDGLDLSPGEMDLSSLSSGVEINTDDDSVSMYSGGQSKGVVSIRGFDGAYLGYTEDVVEITATDGDDVLLLNSQGLDYFDLLDGNDVADFSQLQALDSASGELGAGRDRVKLQSYGSGGLEIFDFEIGLDVLQYQVERQIDDSTDIYQVNLQGRGDLLSQLEPDYVNFTPGRLDAGSGVELNFASVAFDLDADAGIRTVFADRSPVLDSSVLLEPGDFGDDLTVSFVGSVPAGLSFDVIGSQANTDWEWDLAGDGSSATLSRSQDEDGDVHQGIHYDLSSLHQLKNSLTISSSDVFSGSGAVAIKVEWGSGDGSTTSFTRHLQVEESPSPASPDSGLLDFSRGGPVKLEFVAPAPPLNENGDPIVNEAGDPVQPEPVVLLGSQGGDDITLLSDALSKSTNTAFGGGANDVLTASDGNNVLGGRDDDTLIALHGSGVTRLTGDAGHDALIGGQNDVLVAGSGDDLLIARGTGNKLSGGVGADDFVLFDSFLRVDEPMGGRSNRILDYNAAEGDRLIVNIPGLTSDHLIVKEFGSGFKLKLSETFASQVGRTDLAIVQNLGSLNSADISINQSFNEMNASVTAETLTKVSAFDQPAHFIHSL